METIIVIPIGHINEDVLNPLANLLEKRFSFSCTVGRGMELPAEAFNVERSQFLASAILEGMRSRLPQGASRMLGVTDVDLYIPDLNFVFGRADLGGPGAIISMCRLREEFYGLERDETLFRNRMVKEAIHELGHSLGLTHCQNPQCVMSFSNSLIDTDRKGEDFCADCQKQLPSQK